MKPLSAIKLLFYLNLEVVFGAVVNAAVITTFFGGKLSFNGLAVLGLAVWVIYTLDRIKDVRNEQFNSYSKRHEFHKKYDRFLLSLVLLACFIGIYYLRYLSKETILMGFGLSAVIALYYLLFFKRLSIVKELMTAIIYVVGIFIPALSSDSVVGEDLIFIFAVYLCIATVNLLILSVQEFDRDKRNREKNMVQKLGMLRAKRLIRFIFLIGALCSFYVILLGLKMMGGVLLLVLAIYFLLMRYRLKWFNTESLRLVIDLPLLLPGLLLIIR